MEPTISVDLSKALLRFSDAGIPEQVRNNLRRLIPGIAHNITNAINNRMNTQLKSRNTLTVSEKMRENSNQITMEIQILSPSAGGLLPMFLELGTSPHGPVNAQALHFFTGGQEIFTKWVVGVGQRVHGESFMGYHFMDDTIAEYMGDIQDTLNQAVQDLPE